MSLNHSGSNNNIISVTISWRPKISINTYKCPSYKKRKENISVCLKRYTTKTVICVYMFLKMKSPVIHHPCIIPLYLSKIKVKNNLTVWAVSHIISVHLVERPMVIVVCPGWSYNLYLPGTICELRAFFGQPVCHPVALPVYMSKKDFDKLLF